MDVEDEPSLEDLKDIPENDPNVPSGYRTRLINSTRADKLIQKGLNYTNKEVEQLFYSSKFLYKGKTLLKKATKINEGEHIDILHADADKNSDSPFFQRVKVLKIYKGTTKKGNPKVAIRVWIKPFESKC
ncbi:uncharacterized protein LOC127853183 [Dreissena polymorpha]|nr:uncharacterized protein LOC127853183 [Dreissena polymorpha]